MKHIEPKEHFMIIGSGMAEKIDAVLTEDAMKHAVLSVAEINPKQNKVYIIKAQPKMEQPIIESNPRGIVPPNFYKRRKKK